jgi:hypothetical protein
MSLPETTTLGEILLYLGVLTEEAEAEEATVGEPRPATLTMNSDGMCCVTDRFHGDRYLTLPQLLKDMRQTID